MNLFESSSASQALDLACQVTWLHRWARDLLVEKALREGDHVFDDFLARELRIISETDFQSDAISSLPRELAEQIDAATFKIDADAGQNSLQSLVKEARGKYVTITQK